MIIIFCDTKEISFSKFVLINPTVNQEFYPHALKKPANVYAIPSEFEKLQRLFFLHGYAPMGMSSVLSSFFDQYDCDHRDPLAQFTGPSYLSLHLVSSVNRRPQRQAFENIDGDKLNFIAALNCFEKDEFNRCTVK